VLHKIPIRVSIFIELIFLEKFDKTSPFFEKKIEKIEKSVYTTKLKIFLKIWFVVQLVVLRLKGTKKSKKQQIMTIVTFKMASFGIYIYINSIIL
jgi:hypothetical protein